MAKGLLDFFATGQDLPESGGRGWIDAMYRRHRLRVMLAITLGYGLIYTCRLALGVVKKPLIDAGVFSPAELGMIGSALFYTYAIGKLTNGFLADHANMRRFLAFSFMATAICNVFMGFTTALWAAVLLWGINGWFQSFGAPGGVVAMTAWFSNRERGRMYGIWSTAHSIGEGLTFLVVGSAVAAFGWRWGFLGPGLIGAATAIGVYLMLQDRPRTLGLPAVNDWKGDHYREAPQPDIKTVLGLQLSILKLPAIWILCLAAATTYVTRYGINSWGILYLQEERGYTLPMAGTLLMISTLAGMAGAVGFGFISDRIFDARRPPVNLLFAVIELVGLFVIFFGPGGVPWLVTGMVLFGMGLTGLVTSLGGLFAVDIAPKRVAGAAMGVIGIFSYIGAGIQEQVSGALIEKGMTMVGDVRHYDFGPAIWFWIGSSVLSMLLAASLWRTRLEGLTMLEPSANLLAMIDAACAAGRGLMERQSQLGELAVRAKSGPADLVSMADEEAENTTRSMLATARPDYAFLGEEGGAHGSAEHTWIVDPLDGTTNFLFGSPLWGVNVALAHRDQIIAGVTFLPALDELYIAETGKGAWLNGLPLKVSPRANLREAVLSCGIPFAGKPDHAVFAREMATLTEITFGMRRTGACSVDMAYVAAGRWDAYWERCLNAWDMAPGVILVQEAGGLATSVTGAPLTLHGGNVCVSNGAIHAELMEHLNLALRGEQR